MKALLLLIVLCHAFTVHAGEAEQVFERVHGSVVTISTLDERKQIDGEGSGVVVGPEQVVTNCHVVNEANEIVVNSAEQKLSATLVAEDLSRDLCMLRVARLKASAVKIRPSEELTKGEPVYAVGNPLGFGLSVSAGLVSNIKRSPNDTKIFTNAPVSPGSSGGGLFDAQGRLAGIVTLRYFSAQNFNMAVPAEWISDLLQKGPPPPKATNPAPDPTWRDTAESLRNSGDWAKLVEWARSWGKAWPTSSSADYYLAVALYKTNQTRQAEEALQSALKKNPRDVDAVSYLSIVHRTLGDKNTATEDLRRALTLQPSLGYGYRILAEWQKIDGNLDEAVISIETALRLNPGEWNSWAILGEMRHRKHQYREAAEAYRCALRLKPNDPTVSSNLASALAYLGESDAARRALADNSGKQSNDYQTWHNIGVAEGKKQHYFEAEKAYRKALELNPSMSEAWNNLGGILQRSNRSKEAEDAFREAVKLKPDFAVAWRNLGAILKDRGAKEEAIKAYEKATLADPTFFDAWYSLGLLLRGEKKLPQAVAALQKAIKLDSSKSGLWAMLGETQIRLGHDEEGLTSLQEAEKVDPKNEAALQGLAMYYGRHGDYDRAILYADRALETNPASANSWSNKGYSFLRLKRYAEAEQALGTAIRLQPDFANAWINLGETYLRKNEAGKAIVTLERGLQLAPGAPDAQLFIAQAYAGTGQYAKAQALTEKLLQQQPKLPAAWVMQTVLFIQQNKKLEALSAYGKLKALNPGMAKELREQFRNGRQQYDLPE